MDTLSVAAAVFAIDVAASCFPEGAAAAVNQKHRQAGKSSWKEANCGAAGTCFRITGKGPRPFGGQEGGKTGAMPYATVGASTDDARAGQHRGRQTLGLAYQHQKQATSLPLGFPAKGAIKWRE